MNTLSFARSDFIRPFEPHPELQGLIDLCLNCLEAYSAVFFAADRRNGPMRLRACRSLSENIDPEALILPGQGLLGWAYKNNRPLNVDRVGFESDRLLFYSRDENIKSFMAVPLPEVCGVLAVDSKQRYIFTDKSTKLLSQFGQSISSAWRRLFGRPQENSGGGQRPSPEQQSHESQICALWQGIELCLSRSEDNGGGLNGVLELVHRFTGLSWAFLTVLKPQDKKNYYLAASSGFDQQLDRKHPMTSGLAGWLHTKQKVLAIDRLKVDSRQSFIFQQDEPIRPLRCFYGWPILYNGRPRGSLMVAGRDSEILAPACQEVMECVVSRLGAQLHHDRLIGRLLEMGNQDPQTGLSHRSHFLDSLLNMMEVADMKNEGVDLFVLATSGLGAFASANGQEAANDLLRSIARQLKEGLRPGWRLGHVSYGVFTLATPTADVAEAKFLIAKFKKSLEDWPLAERSGRVDLGLFPALASYPRDGNSPEQLLELALTALAETED